MRIRDGWFALSCITFGVVVWFICATLIKGFAGPRVWGVLAGFAAFCGLFFGTDNALGSAVAGLLTGALIAFLAGRGNLLNDPLTTASGKVRDLGNGLSKYVLTPYLWGVYVGMFVWLLVLWLLLKYVPHAHHWIISALAPLIRMDPVRWFFNLFR